MISIRIFVNVSLTINAPRLLNLIFKLMAPISMNEASENFHVSNVLSFACRKHYILKTLKLNYRAARINNIGIEEGKITSM